MYFYIYEIKNNINGKIYIGVHRTNNLDDGYMGSGKLLKHAIKKHGKEKFTKTILEFFETADAMYKREKEIVNEEFIKRNDVYNRNIGGDGYWSDAARSAAKTPEARQKLSNTIKTNKLQAGKNNSQYGLIWITHNELGNKKCSADDLVKYLSEGWHKGRSMPPEWGENLSIKLKGRSFVELHGKEAAAELIRKRSETRKNKNLNLKD